MPNLEGEILKGRYRIDALIGRGGMAEVYKAWDTRRQYHVAVKVMREDLAEDAEFLHRFKREARALATLSHANIVRFYSFEREGRLAFIVMDYVAGTTLRGRILDAKGAPLPLEEAASILQQVCAALHYAHTENVLHRDVKPGNIMMQPNGRVLVTDFGIAKAADAATATTVMPGTPAYMSPEQCRSEPLDERADVYALGILAYEMLTGRRPFLGSTNATTGSTREKIRWEQMHAKAVSLRMLNPKVPVAVEEVVRKALAKDRQDRWPAAMTFWQEFAAALQASGLAVARELTPIRAPQPKIDPGTGPVAIPGRSPSSVQPVKRIEPDGGARPASPAASVPQEASVIGLRRVPAWAWPLLVGLIFIVVIVIIRSTSGRDKPMAEETTLVVVQVTATATATPEPTATDTPQPSPTPEPTATVDEVATGVAKAAAIAATLTAQAPTSTPSFTSTSTPTSTRTPTRTPRPTATDTPVPKPTATRAPTRRPTARPTATPRRSRNTYAAPELLAPDDWAGFKGRDTAVILRWDSDANLRSDEYFLVKTATGPNFEMEAQWLVKEKRLQLPPVHGAVEYWTTFGQKTRWTVTVVQSNGKTVYRQLSPESVTRHFVWTELN